MKSHGIQKHDILYQAETPMALLIVYCDSLFVSTFKGKEIRLMSVMEHYHRRISIENFLLKLGVYMLIFKITPKHLI